MAVVLLLLMSLVAAGAKPASDVVASVVIYRHGDRTPVDPYPTDPYRDPNLWPVPFGQLTKTGILQHYQLGKKLRQRYQHLLKDKFDPVQIRVQSTDVDRTLISALSNLAGLYPMNENEFIPGVLWQPIPVHTVPEQEDEVLAMKAPCEKFNLEKKMLLETDYFKNLDEEFRPLYRYVSNHTGKNLDMTTFCYIYDTLMIEELYNFTLPEWTKAVYPDKMEPVCKLNFMVDTFTPSLARLKIGPLVKEITKNLIDVSNGNVERRVWIYSAHDTTIASLLNGLDLKSYIMVPYAAHLTIELLTDDSIRVRYQDEVINIPNCGSVCPLRQWATNYEHLFPTNHAEECKVNVAPLYVPDSSPVIYTLLVIIILLILVNVSIFIIMRRWFMMIHFK